MVAKPTAKNRSTSMIIMEWKVVIILAFSWFFIIKINELEGRREGCYWEALNDNSFAILIISLSILHPERHSWMSALYTPRRIAGHVINLSFNYRALKAIQTISRLSEGIAFRTKPTTLSFYG